MSEILTGIESFSVYVNIQTGKASRLCICNFDVIVVVKLLYTLKSLWQIVKIDHHLAAFNDSLK